MKHLLFDFDGVIVNTFDACFDIASGMTPGISQDEYRAMMSGNIYEQEDIKDRMEKEVTVLEEDPFFLKYVPALMGHAPVPGMIDLIQKLGEDFRLVVVSSTITSPIEEYLRTHDLFDLFDKVYGADVHLSKHVKIEMVFEEFKTSATDCLFITDTLGDMREATKAGVPSIGVSWGFQKTPDLLKGKPLGVADNAPELEAMIKEWENSTYDL